MAEDVLEKILKKIEALETRIKKLENNSESVGARQEEMRVYDAVAERPEERELKVPLPPPPPPKPQATPVEPKKRISEAQIGKEWFNKIGAVSIIIGVVLFIGYTFQYLGPLGKISIGYVVSLILIGLGFFFSKKYKNYANGLLAVGWAIAYFTTFATYYIDASKIIFDANLNLTLLFIVSGALAVFSYYYHSEKFSIMAVCLGAISAITSDVSFVSLLAIIILILYTVALSIIKNWAVLGYCSVVISYFTYWVALSRQGVFRSYDLFQIGSLFLIVYFLVFIVISFFLKSGKYKQKKYISSLVVINVICFFILFQSQLYTFYPNADGYFSGILGILLLLIASISYSAAREKDYIYIIYGWLGWGFTTLAIPLQLAGTWISGAWLVEGAALLIMGLYRNNRRYMYAGAITLSLFLLRFLAYDLPNNDTIRLLGSEIKSRVIFSLFTVFVFGAITFVWDSLKGKFSKEFNNIISLPTFIAAVILMIIMALDFERNYLSVFFLIEGAALYGIGLVAQRRYLRVVSFFPLVGFVLTWLGYDCFNRGFVNENIFGNLHIRTINSLVGAFVFYALYVFASIFSKYLDESEKSVRDFFAILASGILAILALMEANKRIISVIWSIEGTLILLAGFAFKKRILRLIGMVILLLTILRLFIIDLSFLETVYRIVSFIVLGVVLMGVSFIYTKYKDKIL